MTKPHIIRRWLLRGATHENVLPRSLRGSTATTSYYYVDLEKLRNFLISYTLPGEACARHALHFESKSGAKLEPVPERIAQIILGQQPGRARVTSYFAPSSAGKLQVEYTHNDRPLQWVLKATSEEQFSGLSDMCIGRHITLTSFGSSSLLMGMVQNYTWGSGPQGRRPQAFLLTYQFIDQDRANRFELPDEMKALDPVEVTDDPSFSEFGLATCTND